MALNPLTSPSHSVSTPVSPVIYAPLATFDTDSDQSSKASIEQITVLSASSPTSPTAAEQQKFSTELVTTTEIAPIPIEVIHEEGDSHVEHKLIRSSSPSIISFPLVEPAEIHSEISPLKALYSSSCYSWTIVISTFVVNFILEGLQLGISVFVDPFKEEFKTKTSETGWVVGIFLAMPHLAAPIASKLVNRYGCRKMTIVGSLLTSLGVGISSQVSSISMVFLSYGFIGGFGLSLVDIASNVILNQHFDHNLSLMSGISVCGAGVGTLVLVPFTELLVKNYGWRFTNLVSAGIYFLMVFCGLLYRSSSTKPDNSLSISRYSCRLLHTTSKTKEKWHKNLRLYFTDGVKSVLEPLKYKGFVIFSISNFIFYLFIDVPYVFPINGVAGTTLIICFIGISNVTGQIFFGWLGDQKYKRETVYANAMILCGLSVLAMPFVSIYRIPECIAASLFGFFVSGNYALTNIILKNQLYSYVLKNLPQTGKREKLLEDKFSNAYALLFFLQGVGNLFGPPLAGSFLDQNSPDMSYYLAGVAIMISGLPVFLTPFRDYLREKPPEIKHREASNLEAIGDSSVPIP